MLYRFLPTEGRESRYITLVGGRKNVDNRNNSLNNMEDNLLSTMSLSIVNFANDSTIPLDST